VYSFYANITKAQYIYLQIHCKTNSKKFKIFESKSRKKVKILRF